MEAPPVLRIVVPAKVHTHTKFVISLLSALPQIHPLTGFRPDIRFMCGKSNIDQARSMLATDFYNQCTDRDVMLFIDSDHLFSVQDIANAVKLGGDVTCGIYPNALGKPTCYMMDPEAFLTGRDNRLRYAGTGFMLIRRPILTRILELFERDDRFVARARVSGPDYNHVIPFFKQQIIPTEIGSVPDLPDYDWLGEDYSFCWFVRQCEGTIKGFFTKTLAHEVPNIRTFYPENIGATKLDPTEINRLIEQSASAHKPEQSTIEPEPSSTDTVELPLELQRLIAAKQSTLDPIYQADITDIQESDATDELDEFEQNEQDELDEFEQNEQDELELDVDLEEVSEDIVYYCGHSRVKFGPEDSQLGGSEQAVVNLARAWTKQGQSVVVYGNVNVGEYDGVRYLPAETFDFRANYKRLIFWRGFGMSRIGLFTGKTEQLIVDLHDHTSDSMFTPDIIDRVDYFMVKSKWHASFWPRLPSYKIRIVPNAIDLPLYNQVKAQNITRQPLRMCYTSCYTRGLVPLLEQTWPFIRHHLPGAKLYVCYGSDLIENRELQQRLERALKQPGVIHLGRINHDKVARLQASCSLHLYPCNMPKAETDCLSVRESAYLGCQPVVFGEGVFLERNCIQIPHKHNAPDSYRVMGAVVVKLLQDQTALDKIRAQSQNREISWDQVAQLWQTMTQTA